MANRRPPGGRPRVQFQIDGGKFIFSAGLRRTIPTPCRHSPPIGFKGRGCAVDSCVQRGLGRDAGGGGRAGGGQAGFGEDRSRHRQHGRTVLPGDDFFAYVNGGWLKTRPFRRPLSYSDVATPARTEPGSGAGRRRAAAARSADARKFGDIYASFMDGGRPSRRPVSRRWKADLATIAAVKTPRDLARDKRRWSASNGPSTPGSPQRCCSVVLVSL